MGCGDMRVAENLVLLYTELGVLGGLRALALKNAHAIFKHFLTFYGSKCAASKDAKHRNCKRFYNSATIQFNL